tara:strand:- start:1134 stop:1769 length:636 start_codon:yes stop_codon:yes gene_type:complete
MIIGLVGFMGSGKNTVANYFIEQGFRADSFAGPLKDVCSAIFGWPRNMLEGGSDQSRTFREMPDAWWGSKLGNKKFSPRMALQYIGTEVFREGFNPNIWLHSMEQRYTASGQKPTVITDCRFRNEVNLIKSLGGKIIRIKRGPEPHWQETAIEACSGDIFALQSLEEIGIHRSEWDWLGCKVDWTIDNDCPLPELQDRVAELTSGTIFKKH